MVKVIGLTKKEKNLRDKKSRLIEITEKVFGDAGKKRIYNDPTDWIFLIKHHSLEYLGFVYMVNVQINRVTVFNSSYFEEAKALAGAYEAFTSQGFKIKKRYE
jgi:hypothetical protein